jgi:signal transduction histidine kinase
MGHPLPDELVAEIRALMLRRTRVAIHLGWSIHLAFVAIDAWRLLPDRYPEAVVLRLAGVALLLLLLPATRTRHALRWSAWLGAGAIAVMMLITTSIMPLFQGARDPQYAIQGTGLVLCVLGAGIILPLDAAEMLLLGVVAVALHVGFTVHFAPMQNFPVLLATVSSVVIATAGARELGRSRRAEFEGRRAKDELWRARSDFVAMLTHDIRNPLAAIDGYVEMLRAERDLTPAEREELLAHVQRAVRHAIALAGDFLDASKVEADRFALKAMHAIDLGELIQGVVADHRPHAAQKGIDLVHTGSGTLPPVRADATALDRVFANLVGNAIKHTPAGGSIRVAAELPAPGWLAVVVEDTGEGIVPGQEARLFDRYTQAASRADSTGLGLFIARTITTAHGGTISAENRRDRRGARFRVVLPTLAD